MKPQSSVSSIPRPAALVCWRRGVLAAAMVTALSAPCAIAFDDAAYPDGSPPDGSAAYPWKIDRPQDFDAIGADGLHAIHHHYRLTRDLDFAGGEHRVRAAFAGTFDGGYHRITNLVIDQPAETGIGLCKSLAPGGVIRRLAILDSEFRANRDVGSLVGSMAHNSRIEECWARGNVVTAVSFQSAGGLVGGASLSSPKAVLANSFSRDNQVSSPGHQTAGGISGYQDAHLEFCYSAGNTISAPRYVGGIVGYGTSTGSIIFSYSDVTNNPPFQVGQFSGSWLNPLVPDRLSAGFNIKAYTIPQLGWNPSIWRKGADSYPWLIGFSEEPVADAGPDQTIQLGSSARLDASATSDDFTPFTELAFAWTILDAPVGSSALLADETTATPALKPALAGDYLVGLTVTDGGGLSATAQTTVTATAPAPNGSFENDFAGWGASGNVAVLTGPPYQPTHGEKLAVFNSADSLPGGELSRLIATVPGQAYRLEYDAGVLAFNRDKQKLGMTLTGNTELLADEFILTGPGSGKTLWVKKSYVFTADANVLTLLFRDLSTATRSIDLLVDHVRVTPLVTTLTLTSLPAPGVEIFVSPAGSEPKANGETTTRIFYNPGSTVYLSAPFTAGGRSFSHWLLDGKLQGVKPSMGLVMDTDRLATAVYQGGEPVITLQPVSAEAVIGGRALFRVAATGTEPLAYQWQFNGEDIVGADSPYWEVLPVEASSAGIYQVIVSNPQGSVTSAPAELVVLSGFPGLENGGFESEFQGWTVSGNVWIRSAPPYLPTEGLRLAAFNPANTAPNGTLSRMIETTPGQTYFLTFDAGVLAYNTQRQTLEVEVTGSPRLLRQSFVITGIGGGKTVWRNCALAFTADSTRTTIAFRDLSATTSSIDLLLDNVAVVPRVERMLTVATGDAPVLVRIAPPDLDGLADSSGEFTRKYIDGTSVTLDADARYGGMYFDKTRTWSFLRWMRDGAEFSSSPVVTIAMDADIQMRAEYKLDPPVIFTQPVDLFAAVGGAVTFQADACGGVDSYQWRHMGVPIPGAKSHSLTVAPVTLDSAGSYDVLVTNAGGTTASRVATLTVVENGPFNPSFEAGLDDWTSSGNVRVQRPPPGTAPDGDWVAAFNSGNTAPNGWLAQIIATHPGARYRLSFDMGVLAYNTREQKLRVDLDGNGAIARETFTMRGLGGGQTVWLTQSLEFTADATAVLVTFQDVSTVTNAIDLLLDDVQIEELTPEGFSLIPAGWFTMGADPDGGSTVTANISAFHLAIHEVTLSQWQAVQFWARHIGYADLPAGGGKGPDHPVHALNWYDVVKWCNARSEMEGLSPCYSVAGAIYRTGTHDAVVCDWNANGYRLPTEAEWEKAARGGLHAQRFPWGNTISQNLANYFGDTSWWSYDLGPDGYNPLGYAGDHTYTTPPGTFAPNGYGLHDMAGNVMEWCWDWVGWPYTGGTDPRGPSSGSYRVIRGGSWAHDADYARVADRGAYAPNFVYGNVGFRPARSSVP